jgi:predicted metal-binding membrane protein
MARTTSIRQDIGRIAARRGREEATLWALHNGYAVSWKGGSLTVRPL